MLVKLLCYLNLLLFVVMTNSAYSMGQDEFKKMAIKSIYKVVPTGNEKFKLKRPNRDSPQNIVLYSSDKNLFKEIDCLNTVMFGVVAKANDMGFLKIAICPNDDNINIDSMKKGYETAVSSLDGYIGGMTESEKKIAGFKFEKQSLNDGSIVYHFPLVTIGHGVMQVKTSIIYPSNNEFLLVIQHYPEELCVSVRSNRLCEVNHGGIIDVAMDLMTKYRSNNYQ